MTLYNTKQGKGQKKRTEGQDVLCDTLKKQGINAKGYGILFKYPMLDPDLTIEAKGIYCYICSYAGSDSTAFPGQSKIMADLKMCKDAYYKHYHILQDNGYIRVTQENEGGCSHGYQKNIYEIVECPEKFSAKLSVSYHHTEAYAKIRSGGLHDAGFGYIPRAVMVDRRLSVKAKALYGYYRTFSGAGASACPERKDLLYHLGISAKLYQRLLAELAELNYITVIQRHVNGRLSVNDIQINSMPDEMAAGQGRGVLVLQDKVNSFVRQKQETQIQESQIQEGQKQETQIQEANIINKITKTNFYQNQSVQNQTGPVTDGWMMKKEENRFFASREEAHRFALEITDHDNRDDKEESTHRLFVEALTDMLSSNRPMSVAGERVSSFDINVLLREYVDVSYNGSYMLRDIEEITTENYELACANRQIKNHLAYMKACIWSALKTGNAGLDADVRFDLEH